MRGYRLCNSGFCKLVVFLFFVFLGVGPIIAVINGKPWELLLYGLMSYIAFAMLIVDEVRNYISVRRDDINADD
tara:strand:+ start:838 stop:1059 length:222 start_codon:yes stop_codon:yes gene_type:complete